MKFANSLTFIFLLALAVAQKSFGSLTITSVDNYIIDRGVMIINNVLRSGKKFSVFTMDDEDTIVSFSLRKRVAVDEAKRLSLESKKDKKNQTLSLAKLGSEKKWQLQANGSTEFQLCEDGSIGFKSDCQGSKSVLLHFMPIF